MSCNHKVTTIYLVKKLYESCGGGIDIKDILIRDVYGQKEINYLK